VLGRGGSSSLCSRHPPAEAGPGTYFRGIAMVRAEEFVSSKQQQNQVPAGIFPEAVIALESIQEQNLSRVGSFILLLIYMSIFYMRSPELPYTQSLGTTQLEISFNSKEVTTQFKTQEGFVLNKQTVAKVELRRGYREGFVYLVHICLQYSKNQKSPQHRPVSYFPDALLFSLPAENKLFFCSVSPCSPTVSYYFSISSFCHFALFLVL